ncbi:DUF2829 domain-containing protein [Xenorhabdus sp. 12]|uniref:DUF2829 domain-containing protein n=1 Tax=Xenorhabdus santafensis TaxID=2582833 RepID=A0ABU4SAQ9_9GAMM|nr:MW1434 family type I TA system toxin [Xenorhabdus sp. 12]MDX7987845.1 DUF2829 domain-containing protein [Xenorhabdus sp. 12]
MSEVNKPEKQNKKMGFECQINPDDYKVKAKVELSNDITAPVGSFPWAIIQVYLGKKMRCKDWSYPEKYIYLNTQKADDDKAEQVYLQVHDRHDHSRDWLPDQDDMVACDWEEAKVKLKPVCPEDSMYVFDLTIEYASSKDTLGGLMEMWGYVDETDAIKWNPNHHAVGAINIVSNNAEIVQTDSFYWVETPNTSGSWNMLKWNVSTPHNKESYEKIKNLFNNKNLYITVDSITYYLGKPYVPTYSEDVYKCFTSYALGIPYSSEAGKLREILKQQIGKTKRFCVTWRDE